MRKSVIALAALAAFGLSSAAVRADEAKKTEMTGVLIDNHCGEDMAKKDAAEAQKAAADHKKGCAVKCGKEGGFALMQDGKLTKFDEKSNEKAMEYLKDKSHGTSVAIEASKNDDGTLSVASIEPAKKEETK